MIKFRVVGRDIEIFCHKILEVGEASPMGDGNLCLVDNAKDADNFSVFVFPDFYGRPVKIGAFAHYDVCIDDFRVIDLEELNKNPKLQFIAA